MNFQVSSSKRGTRGANSIGGQHPHVRYDEHVPVLGQSDGNILDDPRVSTDWMNDAGDMD